MASKLKGGKAGLKKVVEKIIHGRLRTNVPAGQASTAPPLGQQLSQRGINTAAFVKDFNNRTAEYNEGVPVPIRVTTNPDRSYDLTIHTPVSIWLVLQAAGAPKGATAPGREVAGWITLKHVYEIALIKSRDPPLELTPLNQICEKIIGTAHSCGIEVRPDYDPEEYREFLVERALEIERQKKEILEIREAKLLRK